jgi:hypothetical protein
VPHRSREAPSALLVPEGGWRRADGPADWRS